MQCPILSAALALSLCHGVVHAQVDAGAMTAHTQDVWQARHESLPQGFPLEYQPRMRWTDDFSIQIDSIVIQGNTKVSDGRLQMAVKGYNGKRVMVDRLGGINAAVTRAYREAGLKAKVYIPEQTMGGGRLIVQVIEL